MKAKFAHINIVARDWRKLSEFYIKVFDCKPKPPERKLSGAWLDELTGLNNVQISGMHLLFPGYDQNGPTLEIFEYLISEANENKAINKKGFAHIAFAVDDVEKCLELIMKNGGSAVGKVVKTEIENVGQIHVVYAKDPEENLIEIQKWK